MTSSLKSLLRANQILDDSDSLSNYGRDWTRAIEPKARAIVFPESTADVKKLVKWARENKTPLVPSGGRTGLSGGAVAVPEGSVVVSLDRMNRIFSLNEIDRTVHLQSGVITESLQNYAKDRGFYFPVDFASRGSSQIGGNISTNAGGVKVIRYGVMRDWVASLEVVTGAGEILKLSRDLIKDNSGYDLKQLFIGSEGTLGIITEASVRVTTPPKEPVVLLLSSSKLSHSMEILKTFQSVLPLTAFEFFTDRALNYVLKSSDFEPPFSSSNPAPVYILIEFENLHASSLETAMDAFDRCTTQGWVNDGVISQTSEQAASFWKYRENISESLSKFKPYKNDISVRISEIPNFVDAAEKSLTEQFPGTEIVWFGHIGDGNLHINVLNSSGKSREEFAKDCDSISQILFKLLQKFGGSISAEHGIGLLKKPYLHFTRSKEEIALMKSIKRVFDPDLILNPGKIFDI